MPIYAYKCESCGFAKDVLQKISDPHLSDCPQCGKASFQKQVTAAGFQLKGSGWYVTDFRGGDSAKAPAVGAVAGTEAGAVTPAMDTPVAGATNSESSSSASASPAPTSAPTSTPTSAAPASPTASP